MSALNIDKLIRKAVENVLKKALMEGSTDNVSVVIVLFERTITYLN